jgi:hypothetical protein
VPALGCAAGALVEPCVALIEHENVAFARLAPRLETGIAAGAVVGVRHPLH